MKYTLQCHTCGEWEERNTIREIARCFNCKKKRKKERYLQRKKEFELARLNVK